MLHSQQYSMRCLLLTSPSLYNPFCWPFLLPTFPFWPSAPPHHLLKVFQCYLFCQGVLVPSMMSSYPLLSAITLNFITENAQKGSLVDCQEDVPYTALTIVCTINVSIDCDWFQVSNPSIRKNILKIKSSQ